MALGYTVIVPVPAALRRDTVLNDIEIQFLPHVVYVSDASIGYIVLPYSLG
jgi:hypothetical protein